jgi:ERO1-like protein alpha
VIQQHNTDLLEKLNSLRDADYLSLFSVDILGSCEYMPQEIFECYTESCEIYPVDEGQVPTAMKQIDSKYDFTLDGWGRWDMPTEDYYDIREFPEDYTGYDGSEVWKFIHNRICFPEYGYATDHWKADFNKAVSGLHAVVSAQIIRGIQERITSGQGFAPDEKWTDPHAEFQRRLSQQGETPQALENMYFVSMLVLRAVDLAKDRILADQSTGCLNDVDMSALQGLFNTPLFAQSEAKSKVDAAVSQFRYRATRDKDSVDRLWEARMRTREIMRIMNCVQCNKCRLHGKIVTMGVSTALQILLGHDGQGQDPRTVQRVELATLLTTLHKCCSGIDLCLKMEA